MVNSLFRQVFTMIGLAANRFSTIPYPIMEFMFYNRANCRIHLCGSRSGIIPGSSTFREFRLAAQSGPIHSNRPLKKVRTQISRNEAYLGTPQ